MPNDWKSQKYAVGQVLMFERGGKKSPLPVVVKEAFLEDGEWFYSIDRKNALHEPMLRQLNEAEIGTRPPVAAPGPESAPLKHHEFSLSLDEFDELWVANCDIHIERPRGGSAGRSDKINP